MNFDTCSVRISDEGKLKTFQFSLNRVVVCSIPKLKFQDIFPTKITNV